MTKVGVWVAAVCLFGSGCSDDSAAGGAGGSVPGDGGASDGGSSDGGSSDGGSSDGGSSDGGSSEGGSGAGAPTACSELFACWGGCDADDGACPSVCFAETTDEGRAQAVEFGTCAQTVCSAECYSSSEPVTCAPCLIAECPESAFSCRGLGSPGRGNNLPDPITEACAPTDPLPGGGCVDAPAGATVWAQAISAHSSAYDEEYWGATQALGPPDVYPCYGDGIAGTWQPLAPVVFESVEFITVDLGAPVDAAAVLVVETFARPGAEIAVSADGTTFTDVGSIAPGADEHGACIRRVALPTPALAIRYVRVTLGSVMAPGWLAIDAIGIEPP